MIVRLLVSVSAAVCLALAWPAAAHADILKLDTSQLYGSLFLDYIGIAPMRDFESTEGVYELVQPPASSSGMEFNSATYPLLLFSGKQSSVSGYSVCTLLNGLGLPNDYGPFMLAPKGSELVIDFNRGTLGYIYLSDTSWSAEPNFISSSGKLFVHGFRRDGSRFDITGDSSGRLILPEDAFALGFTVQLNSSVSAPTGSYSWFISRPNIYIIMPDDAADAVRDQTDQIMSTDGSDSIVDSVTSGGEDGLLDRLGFIGTAISVPNSILQGMTSTADSSIQFPGVSLPQFDFEIPATSVDVWEYCPELETPCKLICTGVCVFLWLNGVKHLYDRITGKEQEVSIDTDA